MKWLHNGLGALLLFCIGVRVAADVVAPALPVVVVSFVLTSLVVWVLFPTRRL